MDQVAGGAEIEGGGIGLIECTAIGAGFGLAAGQKGGGFCALLGAGLGKQLCFIVGI